jgi:hypothetical protein
MNLLALKGFPVAVYLLVIVQAGRKGFQEYWKGKAEIISG